MKNVELIITARRRLRYAGKKKYGWKVVVNGKSVGIDGRQDFNNAADAEDVATRILSGYYSDFRLVKENVA